MLAIFICDDAKLARFVDNIVPSKAVFERPAFFSPERASIEKEFCFVARSINMNWRDLTDAFGPIPMRQDVRHWKVWPPTRLVNVETIFLKTIEIDNAEIRTSRRNLYAAELFEFCFCS